MGPGRLHLSHCPCTRRPSTPLPRYACLIIFFPSDSSAPRTCSSDTHPHAFVRTGPRFLAQLECFMLAYRFLYTNGSMLGPTRTRTRIPARNSHKTNRTLPSPRTNRVAVVDHPVPFLPRLCDLQAQIRRVELPVWEAPALVQRRNGILLRSCTDAETQLRWLATGLL
jgi:hypothetical protein